jgi:hypothetical protein
MKFTPLPLEEMPPGPAFRLELTRRNLETLLAKLDDPLSVKTLTDPTGVIAVVAVPNEEHYSDRPPGTVVMPSTGEVL